MMMKLVLVGCVPPLLLLLLLLSSDIPVSFDHSSGPASVCVCVVGG